MPSASPRVCVIGLDGATFDVLDRWVKSGDMPNLSRLMDRSARADLISTIPPVTGPAWTSMTTGVNPGKHGIFDFVKLTDNGTRVRLVVSGDVRPPRLWDLLQDAGYRVGVFRVPVTYPAKALDGFLVTGLLTPPRASHVAYPPEVAESVREASRRWLHCLGAGASSHLSPQDILDAEEAGKAAMKDLLERFRPAFFMGVNSEVDHLQHRDWAGCTQASDGAGCEAARRLFRSVDEGIGWLVDFFGPGAYIFIVSDHGFGKLEGLFGVNEWLAEQGYLKLRRRRVLQALLYRRLAGGAKRALAALGLAERARALLRGVGFLPDARRGHRRPARMTLARLVDWRRTSAFFKSASASGILLNTQSSSPCPMELTPGAREELLARLRTDLASLADPTTGEPLVTMVRDREDIFQGPYTDEAPDLLFALKGHAIAPVIYTGGGSTLVREAGFTGTHRENGVFLAAGPGVRPEVVPDLSILDVAPTILHAAGLPVPRYMDGCVRQDLFQEGSPAARSVSYSDVGLDLSPGGAPVAPMDQQDEDAVQQRLRDLGYL